MEWLRQNRHWLRYPLAFLTLAYFLCSVWAFYAGCAGLFQRLSTAGGVLTLLWALVKIQSNTEVEPRLQLTQETLDEYIECSTLELANVIELVDSKRPLGENVPQTLSAQRDILLSRAKKFRERSGERSQVHAELNEATQAVEKVEKQDFTREISLALIATLQGGIGDFAVNLFHCGALTCSS